MTEFDNTAYRALAAIIVRESIKEYKCAVSVTKGLGKDVFEAQLQAEKDKWQEAKAYYPSHSDEWKAAQRRMRLADNYYRYRIKACETASDCERFFRSDWFGQLTDLDGNYIIKHIKSLNIQERNTMGIAVLVLGASGTGKSTSLRNFKPEDVGVFNVANKPLPFRSKLPVINNATYEVIKAGINKGGRKSYVIDDAQFLMANEEFARAKETGYGKFTDIAIHFKELLDCAAKAPEDCIIYFLQHTEMGDDGRLKAKTVGKMLDNHLTVEGMFSIVLVTQTDGEAFQFVTKPDGLNPAKTPMGMFEQKLIDNDLKMVDTTIREYYGFETVKPKKEAKNESN